MKIVINACYGGFGLSEQAKDRFLDIKGWTYTKSESKFSELMGPDYTVEGNPHWYEREIDRGDPVLVQVVEELGAAAHGRHAELRVVDVPDDVVWEIEEYDGREWIAEVHRTWG